MSRRYHASVPERVVTMKQFRHMEAERLGLAPSTIASYISQGKYELETRRPNRRVVFVVRARRLIYEEVAL